MKKILIGTVLIMLTSCCPFPRFWDYDIVSNPKLEEKVSSYPFRRWEKIKNEYDYRSVHRLAGDGLFMKLMTMPVSSEETDACRAAGEDNDYLKLHVGFQAYKNHNTDTYLFDAAKPRIVYKAGELEDNKLSLTEGEVRIYNVAGKRDEKYPWKRVFVFTVCASGITAVEIDGITRNGASLPPYRLDLFPSIFDSDSFMGNLLK